MPIDEECCREDEDPSTYSGKLLNVMNELGAIDPEKKKTEKKEIVV